MAKTKINPLTDKPQNLNDVTQNFMLEYMREVAKDPADREWFKKLCNDNIEKRGNNLNNKQTERVNIKVVRHAFCERYFPTLLKAKRKSASFLDLVNNL